MKFAAGLILVCYGLIAFSGCVAIIGGNRAAWTAMQDTSILDFTRHDDTTALIAMMQQTPNVLNNILYFRQAVPLDVVGDARMAEWLMAHGADPNLEFGNKSTPFMHNVFRSKPNVDVLEAMLKHDAHVNVMTNSDAIDGQYTTSYQNGHTQRYRSKFDNETLDGVDCIDFRFQGETPLHNAAMKGNVAVMNLLLAHRAYVDAKDTKEYTPLHKACLTRQYEAVKLLLDHGAGVNIKDSYGDTPLMVCESSSSKLDKSKIVQLLKEHGGTE